MEVTYDWDCRTVDLYPEENNESNVVYNVHWNITATSTELDDEGNPYVVNSVGTQTVPFNEGSPFIPFEDLTNEIIVGWTKEAMGEDTVNRLQYNLYREIDLLIKPESITRTIK